MLILLKFDSSNSTTPTHNQPTKMTESQGWKCPSCGLPGVRLSVSSDSSSAPTRAFYKCVPCNRSLGMCPCTTPGARITSTCPCGESSDAESPGLDEVPRGVSILGARKGSLNPHNPEPGFDVDWEANCKPGYMVSRFKAQGEEIMHWA